MESLRDANHFKSEKSEAKIGKKVTENGHSSNFQRLTAPRIIHNVFKCVSKVVSGLGLVVG